MKAAIVALFLVDTCIGYGWSSIISQVDVFEAVCTATIANRPAYNGWHTAVACSNACDRCCWAIDICDRAGATLDAPCAGTYSRCVGRHDKRSGSTLVDVYTPASATVGS